MRNPSSVAASIAVVAFHLGMAQPACAQQIGFPTPEHGQRLGPNRIGLDIGVLAASVSYARQVSPAAEWGIAVSGGAQTGFMLGASELGGDATVPLLVELLSAAAFLRGGVGGRTNLEGGARVGWLYHTTEYETLFGGLYGAVQYRIAAVHLGSRIYVGRISEETGRYEFVFAVIPLTVGFRWSW
jgi:hypothetical protein